MIEFWKSELVLADLPISGGSFEVSTLARPKVTRPKAWCVTGLLLVQWDKEMPRPCVQLTRSMRTDVTLALDVVAMHAARAGEPWPTAVYLAEGEPFTVMSIENYQHCNMVVRVFWKHAATEPTYKDIEAAIEMRGVG